MLEEKLSGKKFDGVLTHRAPSATCWWGLFLLEPCPRSCLMDSALACMDA